jgi:hypothetical protein
VRKLFTTKRRIAVVSGVTVVALAGGGVAFAYFTSTGSGTGQAQVGSATNWDVTAGAPSGTMFPGQGATTIVYTVKNVGSGNQTDNTDTVSMPTSGADVTSHGADVPGCLASWFTAGITTDNAQTVDFAPGQTESVTVTVTLSDAQANQNACQGVTPDVTLTVN